MIMQMTDNEKNDPIPEDTETANEAPPSDDNYEEDEADDQPDGD